MATLADDVRDRAFERMYEHYVRDVYRYVLAVLRNPADAEDVTQTTFMNAYRAFKRGERPHKPQNWLITIAHNACRTKAIRSSRRPQEVPLDDVVTQLAVPENEKPNIRELLKVLGRLPFNQRAAIAMRELEGRSYQEIAETLDVSVPAVEALIVRARRTLRAQRTAVRGLTAVQLPRSLRSLFEGSDATTAVAGGLIGGGALAKAAAVLVAGVVAGGVGYTGVGAGIGKRSHPAPARLEPRAPIDVQRATAHAPAPAKKAPAPVRARRPEPAGTARQMPVAPSAANAVVVAPGGATAPITHAGVPDAVGRAVEPPSRAVNETAAAHRAASPDRDAAPGPPAVPAVPPVDVPQPALPQLPPAPQPSVPAPPQVPPAPDLPKAPDLPRTPDLPPAPLP
jgi:RNA polymerase sigma factor (sigma-70 family)